MIYVQIILLCQALSDEKGNYTLNGNNVITQYPRVFAYGGVTFEYTGTNTTMERVNSSFARRIKFDLTVEVTLRSICKRNLILIFFLKFLLDFLEEGESQS